MSAPGLTIHVSPSAALPIYRQIMQQIADAIAGGRLAAGDKLASQRDLAQQLVIAPLTVKKAYDELEREGLITTQRGRGTFVTEGARRMRRPAQIARLREAARQLLIRAHLAAVPLPRLLDLVRDLARELEAERAEPGHAAPAIDDSEEAES